MTSALAANLAYLYILPLCTFFSPSYHNVVIQSTSLQHCDKEERILFNTRAKIYITKLINNFNFSIYLPVSLLLVNIISRETISFSFSKRIIIYIIDIKREIYILNLNKCYIIRYLVAIY
jgi:hypothetical protein